MPKIIQKAPVARPPARKRNRRSPYELLGELKAKREALQLAMDTKLTSLDQRIADLERKHEAKIKVSELLKNKTPDDLEKEIAEMKKQQSLLRKALKQVK